MKCVYCKGAHHSFDCPTEDPPGVNEMSKRRTPMSALQILIATGFWIFAAFFIWQIIKIELGIYQ